MAMRRGAVLVLAGALALGGPRARAQAPGGMPYAGLPLPGPAAAPAGSPYGSPLYNPYMNPFLGLTPTNRADATLFFYGAVQQSRAARAMARGEPAGRPGIARPPGRPSSGDRPGGGAAARFGVAPAFGDRPWARNFSHLPEQDFRAPRGAEDPPGRSLGRTGRPVARFGR